MYLPVIIFVLVVCAFIVDTPKDIFSGYLDILTSKSLLISDYITIGGLGATLFNAATVLTLNLVILKLLDLRLSGILFAAIMMNFGYAFYGKNIINVLPLYLGVFIYSVVNKIHFKNLILVLLFSSGIAPLVSYTAFGINSLELYYSIPLAILLGTLAGFILPSCASHTMKFHQGYNLFNTGFAIGVISFIFYGILYAFGIAPVSIKTNDIDVSKHSVLLILVSAMIVMYVVMALVCDKHVFKKLIPLNKRSGRLISDFERDFGVDTVILNTAMILTLELAFILIFKIKLNGAILGTMLAVAGFAGSGMHIKNTTPIMLGALVMIICKELVLGTNFSMIFIQDNTPLVISILFALCLAPIAGRYGVIAGILAGAMHVVLVPLCMELHGGLNLYNNGFAAGFVACVMIALIEALKEEE